MSLVAATRSEVTKLFTTSGWWVIGLIMVAYLLMQVGSIASLIGFSAREGSAGIDGFTLPAEATGYVYSVAASAGYIFPLLLGTLMVTTEFRHRLITPTFLATPRRGAALAGKMNAGVVAGALYAAVAVAVSAGVGALVLELWGQHSAIAETGTWVVLGRSFLALVLWALIGIGVGSIIRNQIAAIVVALAFTLLVEPVLRLAVSPLEWGPAAAQWLPGAATEATSGYSLMSVSGTSAMLLPWWGGALVLAGYAVVFAIIGSLTTWRRDVD